MALEMNLVILKVKNKKASFVFFGRLENKTFKSLLKTQTAILYFIFIYATEI